MFTPPSISLPITNESTTFVSDIPSIIRAHPNEPCVLGVDEAGRGPVLGPMVYGISYCLKSYENELKSYGFADSKTLTDEKRRFLLEKMCQKDEDIFENVGWCTTSMSPCDISSGMLRPPHSGPYNLNEQAHDTTMALIQKVLDQGVNITEVYVDTVGPPASYQKKLKERFPQLEITVTKKADSLFPIVSTASVCAKVTRDVCLGLSKPDPSTNWGSGYPSDPKTAVWLKQNVDPVFGWHDIVRFSWQTSKDCLANNGGVSVVWEDDLPVKGNYGDVSSMFREESELHKMRVSTLWYGEDVTSL